MRSQNREYIFAHTVLVERENVLLRCFERKQSEQGEREKKILDKRTIHRIDKLKTFVR